MEKKIAIIQSNYIPWKGYFDMIGLVDEFIIYDEVQFTKNDWRNRNKIKTINGTQWITIPVYHKTLHQTISETEISDKKWGYKHWNTLTTNYSKAPYFKMYAPVLEEFYKTHQTPFLSKINSALIKMVCQWLTIKTVINDSTKYTLEGNPTEKLVNLCLQTGAKYYLSGPAAKNYLNENLFAEAGLNVEWMNYNGYPEYSQAYPPFDHAVSILDLLFNMGPDSIRYMKNHKAI
jgi:hypothetical protein